MRMIEQLAWNAFKNTGDINTFLELKQMENIELEQAENFKINVNGEINGINKDEGNSISRE